MSGARRGRLAYLSLETPRPGQASHTHVHEIINGLIAHGWEVDLIATHRGGSASSSGILTRGLEYITAQWNLARRLSKVDAVYMRAHFAALPISLWAAFWGVPVVQEINGQPQDIFVTYPWLGWIGAMITASYRWQMRLADHVIVVTEGLRLWAEREANHSRVSLVGNGANTTLFRPEGSKGSESTAYVAFVGGLTAWHGINIMVAATRDVAWPDDVQLVIIGDGIEREAVAAAANGGRVRALGRLPQEVVATWLRGALCALSITQDAHGHLATGVAPLKLYEAMACGTPVIVTDLPFQSDLVRREQAGFVIPMADASALARAVAQLANDRIGAQEMGTRGAAYVRKFASWHARAGETDSIIFEAIRYRGARGQ